MRWIVIPWRSQFLDFFRRSGCGGGQNSRRRIAGRGRDIRRRGQFLGGFFERMLQSASLSLSGPLAQVSERPLGSAWQFKMNRLVQMLRPWVQYGMQIAQQEQDLDPMIETHVTAIMDVLECIRTCNGISYFEDDAVVSHSRTEFQDLEP